MMAFLRFVGCMYDGAVTAGGAVVDKKEQEKKAKAVLIEAPAISYFAFYFRYAEPCDYLAMFIGAAGGIVTGKRTHRDEHALICA